MKGKQVPETTSSATDVLKAGNRVVALGVAAIVAILLGAAVLLFANLPDANAFNARVERIFVENDDLRAGAEIKLLEILEDNDDVQTVVGNYEVSDETLAALAG